MNNAQPASDNGVTAAPETKVKRLRARYVAGLAERVTALELLFEKLGKTDLNSLEQNELWQVAHKLAGNGATYGFAGISQAAQKLETLLSSKLQQTSALLSVAGRNGALVDDYATLADMLETLARESDACGLESTAEAARSLTTLLGKAVPVPRKLVTSQLKALIDACRDAAAAPEDAEVQWAEKGPVEIVLPKSPRRTVLIVDDDADLRGLMAAAISAFADVIEGGSAREAYALMKRRQPDLVILDDKMPGEASGMMLLERSRMRTGLGEIPVVMMSAHCDAEQITHARLHGAVDFIAKPFDPAETAERIKRRLFRLNKKILIVDDDPAICALLTDTLSEAGFTGKTAWDGRLAIDLMEQARPDLMLLDWRLPGMSGAEILQMLCSDEAFRSLPVLVISAHKRDQAVLSGAMVVDWITKPFSPDKVIAKTAEILDKAD